MEESSHVTGRICQVASDTGGKETSTSSIGYKIVTIYQMQIMHGEHGYKTRDVSNYLRLQKGVVF